jgi:hypothetical protein
MSNVISFNPLDKQNLGASVAEALLAEKVYPLADVAAFNGAGIYAIYYTGDFEPYKQLARMNREDRFLMPIYVGKAVPPGARMGMTTVKTAGPALFKRLKEHLDSVKAAENLDVADFYCRFLVVDDIWIPLGESLVITRYTPLWNSLIDGFGNHNPGKGRHAGMRPRWDVLHPGRAWADSLAERPETQAQIAQEATTYLQVLPACISHLAP